MFFMRTVFKSPKRKTGKCGMFFMRTVFKSPKRKTGKCGRFNVLKYNIHYEGSDL